jgi:hypothetical protein
VDNVAVALLITVLVHFAGVAVLVWALFDGEKPDVRGWWRGDDPRDEWPEPPVPPRPSGEGMPVRDAEPARVRLREPARLGDGYPRPERRPAHVPAPDREREPV